MHESNELFEENAVMRITLRTGKIESFCDTGTAKGKEVRFEDVA